MAINIRLSPTLEARARTRSDDLGISINAIVSVALDAYLSATPHGNYGDNRKEPTPSPLPTVASPAPAAKPPGAGSSKKERQEYTAFQRAQKKLSL